MAEWKKVIVSGSTADLNIVSASNFHGTLDKSLTDGNGIADFTYNGSAAATVTVDLDGSTLALGSSGVKVADGGVGTTQLAGDAVTGAKIADDAIDSEHYTDGSIDTAHIGNLQVTTGKIAADAITAAKLADDAVVTANITDANVTTAKIAADAITGAKIADDAIDSEHYTDGSIDTAHIGNLQVTTGKIAADAITGAKIADNAINSEHYTDGSIDTAHIADNQVTGDKLADDITIAGALTVVGGASASFFSSSGEIVTQGNIITTSGSFSGDGSNLTGVAAASVNIDGLSALGGTGLHQTQDHFMFSDNGTEKKITFSNLQDAIFADVSGDAAIAAGGALTIAADSVENSMLANITRGSVKVGGASNAPTDLDAKTSGQILIGDGTDINSVAVTGDVTITGDGATSIGNNKVTTAKINADAVTGAKIADNAIDSEHYTDGSIDTAHIANSQITTAKIAGDAVTGAKIADDAIDSEHYTDGSIDTAHIANDAVTGDKLANDITIANDLTVTRDLIVNGTSVTVNTANLNVEDPFILLKSGSSNTTDSGIIFGGSTGTANSGKAIIWDASYNSNDGRLAVSTTAVAGDATANFGAGTAGYYVAGVFEGSEADAATAKSDHAGNIRIESSEIYIYV